MINERIILLKRQSHIRQDVLALTVQYVLTLQDCTQKFNQLDDVTILSIREIWIRWLSQFAHNFYEEHDNLANFPSIAPWSRYSLCNIKYRTVNLAIVDKVGDQFLSELAHIVVTVVWAHVIL